MSASIKNYRKTIEAHRRSRLLRAGFSAALAFGFALSPLGKIEATGEITRVTSDENLMQNGKANIYAEAINADASVGLNRFKTFSVDGGEIANLYFAKEAGGINVNTLVNMVNSRIDVYGTVNGIRNSKIGGNLFFLSSQGLVVGATGAINAGSLTVMTPPEDFFEKAGFEKKTNTDSAGAISYYLETGNIWEANADVSKYLETNGASLAKGQMASVNASTGDISGVAIPVNAGGTISIEGKINAQTAVKLAAGTIDVGKYGGVAAIKTGVVFDPSTYAVKENERMTLQDDGNGNLYLADASDESGTIKGDGSITIAAEASDELEDVTGTTVFSLPKWSQNGAKASVTVGEKAEVSAVGDVSISSEASLSGDLKTERILAEVGESAVADTKVLGKVSGKAVSITAKATSEVTGDNDDTLESFAKDYFLGNYLPDAISGKKIEGPVSTVTNITNLLTELNTVATQTTAEANVTIGKDATVKSTGDTELMSTAKSTADISLGLSPNLDSYDDTWTTAMNGGFIWEALGSSANVNVEGKVQSEGKLTAQAVSDTSASLDLAIAAPNALAKEDYKQALINAAVGLINADSYATVNIAEGAELTAEDAASVQANNKTSIKSTIGVSSDENEVVSTAVNVINVHTGANVTNAGKVKGKSVELKADNTYGKLQVKTDNAFGKDDPTYWSKLQKALKVNFLSGGLQTVADTISKVKKESEGKSGQAAQKTEASWNNYFDVGASVSVVNLTNDAKVDLKPKSEISATAGNVDISAQFTMPNNSVKTLNRLNTSKKTEKYGASAAVGIENVDNTANVSVDGKLTATATKDDAGKVSGGTINISSTVDNDYRQSSSLLKKVKDSWQALSDYVKKAKEEKTISDAEAAKAESILDKLNNSKTVDILWDLDLLKEKGTKASSRATIIGQLIVDIDSLRKELTGPLLIDYANDCLVALTNLANAENYATMQVAATANSTKSVATGMLAGSVGVQNIDNISGVAIADGAALTAAENIGLSAGAKGGNVLMAGKYSLVPQETSKGADNAIGGTVSVQNAKTESSVNVGAAKISAGEGEFSAQSKTSAKNASIVTGGSETGTFGITGMVSYLGGTAKSDTSIDTGAELSARGVNIGADTNAIITGMAGDLSSSKATSIGASVSVISYDQIAAARTVANTAARAWSAESLNVEAKNSGSINNLTVAGVSAKGETAKKGENKNNESSGNKLDIRNDKKAKNYIELQDISIDANGRGNGAAAQAEPAVQADNDNKKDADQGKAEKKEDSQKRAQEESKVQVALAGSVSWNDVNTETVAELNGVKFRDNASLSTVKVAAEDSSYVGAYSGAMALTQAGNTGKGGFSAALSGAVAANDLLKNTSATIKDVTLKAEDIENTAKNTGAQVAAGVSLGIDEGDRSSKPGFDVAGSASVNLIDSTVKAKVDNLTQTVTGDSGALKNIAYDKDVQVAGAISADYAKSSAGIGASITVQKVKNDIEATISGSKLGTAERPLSEVQNLAQSKLTQVAGALSTGLITSSGSKTYAAANAAIAINDVDNNASATVDESTVYTDKFSTEARDGKLTEDETENEYVKLLKDMKGSNDEKAFDLEGKTVTEEAAKKGAVDVADAQGDEEGGDQNAVTYKTTEYATTNAGNRIIAGALSLTANGSSQSGVAAGAGVAYSTVDNDFTAALQNSQINVTGADGAKVAAASDTLIVDAGAGAAVKTGSDKGAALAGSGAVSTIASDTQALIENSKVTADKLDLTSETKSKLITVAGELGAATSNATVGLAYAQNNIDNTVKATAKGLTLAGQNAGPSLNIAATNKSSALAVAGAANATLGDATLGITATGAYAGNVGKTDTEAVLEAGTKTVKEANGKDKTEDVATTIGTADKKATGISVKATDESSMKGIAGDLSVTIGTQKTGISLGGAVVNNLLGEEGSKGKIRASISDATIYNDGALEVEAKNKAYASAIAAGGAVAAGTGASQVSAQGSVAITKLYTSTEAALDSTNLTGGTATVKADSTHKTVSTADGLSVSAGTGKLNVAAMGAGSKVVSYEDTSAQVTGGKHDLTSETVSAISDNSITDVAVGASVSASSNNSIAAAGNVAVNTIAGTTSALLSDANIKTTGSLGVLAKSTETLKNYGGALSVGASKNVGAAIGGTVVANKIAGITSADITGSTINAAGDDDGVTVDGAKKKGLIVDAESSRTLKDISLTAGVGASATVGIAADASVAKNTLAGATRATVENTSINKNLSSLGSADVLVNAKDTTDANLNVGTLSVGASGTAGIAAAGSGDSNTFMRSVVAKLSVGSGKAHDLSVRANSNSQIKLTETGVTVGAGQAGVGFTGAVATNSFEDETRAILENATVKATDAVAVDAESAKTVKSYTNAFALTGGEVVVANADAIAVARDKSTTQGIIMGTSIVGIDEAQPEVTLNAKNTSDFTNEISTDSVGIGIGGAEGVLVSVNNFNNTVETSLVNSQLGTKDQAIKSFESLAQNNIKHSFTSAQAAGSVVAAGIGVSVNTLDSGTLSNVSGSKVYADSITAKAKEKRDLSQTTAGVSASAGGITTNVLVNNVGTAVAREYTDSDDERATYDTSSLEARINKALAEEQKNDETLNSGDFTKDAVDKKESASTFDRGGSAQGVHTNLTSSTFDSKGEVELDSHSETNISSKLVNAGVNVAANIAVNVASTSVDTNTGVSLKNSSLEGAGITVSSLSDGVIKHEANEVSAALLDVNVLNSNITRTGENKIELDGSTLKAGKVLAADESAPSLNVSARDAMRIQNNVLGVNGEGIGVSVLLGKIQDYANTSVSLTGNNTLESVSYEPDSWSYTTEGKRKTTIDYGDGSKQEISADDDSQTVNKTLYKPVYGDLTLQATSENYLESVVQSGAVSGADVSVAISSASEGSEDGKTGLASIAVDGTSNFKGKVISLTAKNSSAASASVEEFDGSLIGVNIAKASASVQGGAKVDISSGQTFTGESLTALAKVESPETLKNFSNKSVTQNATAIMKRTNINTIGINYGNMATATSAMTSSVSLAGGQTYLTPTWQDASVSYTQEGTGESAEVTSVTVTAPHAEEVAGNLALTAYALNEGSTKAQASGTDAAIVSTAANTAETINKNRASLTLKGNGETLGSLKASALVSESSDTYADGTGVTVVGVSPVAATAMHTGESKAALDISGTYNVTGDVGLAAMTGTKDALLADALQTTMIGGDAAKATNSIKNTATLTAKDAQLTAGGSVAMGAANQVTFNEDKEYALKANTYSLVSGHNITLVNTVDNKAAVDITGATAIKSDGEQKYWAESQNDINSNAYLFSVSDLEGQSAYNTLDVTSDNKVNLGSGASLTTGKWNSDITLAAYDDEKAKTKTISEAYSGLAVVLANTTDDFMRNNQVKVDGTIKSLHDVNLYAGEGESGDLSRLELDTSAEVFNKAGLPLWSEPTVKIGLKQNNQVNVTKTGQVKAARDVTLYADAGKENIDYFSGSYTLYTGDRKGNYVATKNGVAIVDKDGKKQEDKSLTQIRYNKVIADGSITAGTANAVNITIGEAGQNYVLLTTPEQYAAVEAYYKNLGKSVPYNYFLVVKDADYDNCETDKAHVKKLSEIVKAVDKDGKALESVSLDDFAIGVRSYA